MDSEALKKKFEKLRARLEEQRVACDRVDSWLSPELDRGFQLPRRASFEHRALADLSRTPWLRLVVDNVVQAMYVKSVFSDQADASVLWELWQANNLQSQQVSNHRAMIAYGQSFGMVADIDGQPRIRFYSPRNVAVEYEFVGDEFPQYALVDKDGKRRWFTMYAPGKIVDLMARDDTSAPVVINTYEAQTELPPVVRFCNQLDLDGNVIGEVEPFIPTAQRINKTAYDRLLTQHFNSWKVKTIAGIGLPEQVDEYGRGTGQVDEHLAEQKKLKLAQEDILTASDTDTKFGVLDATALEPFVTSWRSDIEALAAVSQTPAHALTGQMVNLSPEALAAARAPLTQKVFERQMNAGDSYASLLRLAAGVAGDDVAASDMSVRVAWRDMEIRSMSQAVDALGKAATMLGIPKRGLWGMIPGVEQSDLSQWEALQSQEAELDPLNQMMRKNRAPSDVSGDAGGVDQ